MSRLKSRIERLEARIAADDSPELLLIELCHLIKLQDPEAFRRKAMDPACQNQLNMQAALNSPTPKRVLRYFRRMQREQQTEAAAPPSDRTLGNTPPAA